MTSSEIKWDVFISHASEDKYSVAQPLAEMLEKLGYSVWLDENELTLGDSLVNKINEGISKSRFGLVILSKSFLKKDWPLKELNSFVAIETQSEKLILPVWHKVDKSYIAKHSPLLADKLSISTEKGILELAYEVGKVIDRKKNKYKNLSRIDGTKSSNSLNPEVFLIDKQKNSFFIQVGGSFIILAIAFVTFAMLIVLSEDKDISMKDTYIRRFANYAMFFSLYMVVTRLISYVSININYKRGNYSKVNNPRHIAVKNPTYYLMLNNPLRLLFKSILIIFWVIVGLVFFYLLPNIVSFIYNGKPFAIDMSLIFAILSVISIIKIITITKLNKYVLQRKSINNS